MPPPHDHDREHDHTYRQSFIIRVFDVLSLPSIVGKLLEIPVASRTFTIRYLAPDWVEKKSSYKTQS
jgi:hypothetical protein